MSKSSVPHTTPTRQSPEKYAAIYARVSTTDQADKGYSLPTQIEACLDLAEREGYVVPPGLALWREALCCLREWEERRKDGRNDADKLRGIELWNTIVQRLREQYGVLTATNHVFIEDYTGMSLNRPQFMQLRDLVRQRLVHAVIAYDLDRLSRKLAHQLLLSDEFEQAEVALRIVTMPDNAKTPQGQLLTNVRGIIAEYERAMILERTARGRKGRAQAGHVPSGRRTFGYVYVKHADKGEYYDPKKNQCRACERTGDTGACYVVHPAEAALVQRIFRLYLENEVSIERLAALLTREGIPTPMGIRRVFPSSVWHPATIGYVLRNETYTGTMYDGKKERVSGKSNPDKKTRWRKVPREQWIAVDVPPIIDTETFEAAQARLARNKIQAKRNRKHDYLFIGGRLRCGQCGCAMHGATNQFGYSDYRCTRPPFQDIAAPHSRRSVKAAAMETIVWEAVERALHNPALIAAEFERRREGTSAQQADLDGERQHYTRQLAQCDKDLKRWEAAYLGEAIDLADFKAKKAEVDARRTSAEQELAQLDDQQRLIEQTELETTALMDYCVRVRSQLQHLTLVEKRQALEALNITVTWHPAWPEPKIEGSLPPEIFTVVSNAVG